MGDNGEKQPHDSNSSAESLPTVTNTESSTSQTLTSSQIVRPKTKELKKDTSAVVKLTDNAKECHLCSKIFTKKGDKVMECDYCSEHFCIACISMAPALYNHLAGRPDVKWFCSTCNEKVHRTIMVEKEIDQRCKEYFQILDDRVKALETKTKSMVTKEEVKELIQVNRVNDHERGPPQIKVDTKILVKEINERERRKNNALLFKVPEVNSNLKAEVEKKDLETLCKISQITETPIKSEDIKKIARIGKKQEGYTRPVLIEFKLAEHKKALFRNIGKLRSVEDETLKQVVLEHDMTKEERDELKKLRDEAKQREEQSSGNFKLRVRWPPWARYIKKFLFLPQSETCSRTRTGQWAGQWAMLRTVGGTPTL